MEEREEEEGCEAISTHDSGSSAWLALYVLYTGGHERTVAALVGGRRRGRHQASLASLAALRRCIHGGGAGARALLFVFSISYFDHGIAVLPVDELRGPVRCQRVLCDSEGRRGLRRRRRLGETVSCTGPGQFVRWSEPRLLAAPGCVDPGPLVVERERGGDTEWSGGA